MLQVKDVVAKLLEMDQEAYVIQAADAEGNWFGPTEDVYDGHVFVPDVGELHLGKLDENAIAVGYTEEDLYDGEDGITVVVFWPVD